MEISKIVEFFDVDIEEVLSPSRRRHIADVRHIVVLLLYERGMSYRACAKAVNRTDHTTAMHSVKTAKNLLELYGYLKIGYFNYLKSLQNIDAAVLANVA